MEIYPAQPADADVILALQKLAYQSEADLYQDSSLPPLRQTLEDLRHEISTQVFLKAVESSEIIGSVRAVCEGSTAQIGRLLVQPAFQGRGVGTALMTAIEAACGTVERFELFTGEKSVRNIRLYERLGYSVFKRVALTPLITLVYLEKQR